MESVDVFTRLEAAPSLLIVQGDCAASCLRQQKKSSITPHLSPNRDFLLLTVHVVFRKTIYGAPFVRLWWNQPSVIGSGGLVSSCSHRGHRDSGRERHVHWLCIDKQHRWMRVKPWVSTVSMSTVWDRHLTSFLPPGWTRPALPPRATEQRGFTVLWQCYGREYTWYSLCVLRQPPAVLCRINVFIQVTPVGYITVL